jgi:trans-aconitate methyltransferase
MLELNGTPKYTWSPVLYNKSAPFVYSDENTKPLFQLLSAHPGERVADMGCGTGELTLRIQKLVGDEGLVLGVDACENMVMRVQSYPIILVLTIMRAHSLRQLKETESRASFARIYRHLRCPTISKT